MDGTLNGPEVQLGKDSVVRLQFLHVALGSAGLREDGLQPAPDALSQLALWHQAVGGAGQHRLEEGIVMGYLDGHGDIARLRIFLAGVSKWLGANVQHATQLAGRIVSAPDSVDMSTSRSEVGMSPDITTMPGPHQDSLFWLSGIDQRTVEGIVTVLLGDSTAIQPISDNLAALCKRMYGATDAQLHALDRDRVPALMASLLQLYWGDVEKYHREDESSRLLTYWSFIGHMLVSDTPKSRAIRSALPDDAPRYSPIAIGKRYALISNRLSEVRPDITAAEKVARSMGW